MVEFFESVRFVYYVLFFFIEIWIHFDEIFDKEKKLKDLICCKKCFKVLKYISKNGTSNALGHAEKHKTNTPLITSLLPKERVAVSTADKEIITDGSMKLVCKDFRAYSVVEGEGMLDYTHTIWNMGAKYGHGSREEVAKIIPCAQTVSRAVRKTASA